MTLLERKAAIHLPVAGFIRPPSSPDRAQWPCVVFLPWLLQPGRGAVIVVAGPSFLHWSADRSTGPLRGPFFVEYVAFSPWNRLRFPPAEFAAGLAPTRRGVGRRPSTVSPHARTLLYLSVAVSGYQNLHRLRVDLSQSRARARVCRAGHAEQALSVWPALSVRWPALLGFSLPLAFPVWRSAKAEVFQPRPCFSSNRGGCRRLARLAENRRRTSSRGLWACLPSCRAIIGRSERRVQVCIGLTVSLLLSTAV